MRTIDKQYAARAAELYNPTLAPLDTTIGKYIDGPVKIDGNPRANGILGEVDLSFPLYLGELRLFTLQILPWSLLPTIFLCPTNSKIVRLSLTAPWNEPSP